MKLILASESPYRKAQLTAFGLPFQTARPQVDEDQLKLSGPSDLSELTRHLAVAKAKSLKDQFCGDIIIGGDQLVDFFGVRLDKPKTSECAFDQLLKLSGKTHRLLTSIALIRDAEEKIFTNITEVKFRILSDVEIKSYIDLDQPLDCAGSYKIERAGLGLIEHVVTSDPSAIQGIPLISLTQGLRELGAPLSHWWTS